MSAHVKRKKDFKLPEELWEAFERFAPRGKQTAIVESLIASWVRQQQEKERSQAVRAAYQRENTSHGKR